MNRLYCHWYRTIATCRHRHNKEARQRTYIVFLHLGKRICRKMFCFLHTISKQRLETVKAHLLQNGSPVEFTATLDVFQPTLCRLPIVSRWYSSSLTILSPMSFCSPAVYQTTSVTISSFFLRPPRSDKSGCNSTSRFVRWPFQGVPWRIPPSAGRGSIFLPKVLITKPRSDLCWVCKRNTTTIMRAVNRPEEKSEVRTTAVK